jgi:hypothetical protein
MRSERGIRGEHGERKLVDDVGRVTSRHMIVGPLRPAARGKVSIWSVACFKSIPSHFLIPNLGFPIIRSKSSAAAAFGDNVGQHQAREGCRSRSRRGRGEGRRRRRLGAAVLRRDLLRHHRPEGGGRATGQRSVADAAATACGRRHPLRRLGLQ